MNIDRILSDERNTVGEHDAGLIAPIDLDNVVTVDFEGVVFVRKKTGRIVTVPTVEVKDGFCTRDDARFCSECGAKLYGPRYPKCFCWLCGAELVV